MTEVATARDALSARAAQIDPHALREIESPDWSAKRWHSEHYVDSDVVACWAGLPIEAKLVAFIYASSALEADDPDRDWE